MNRNKFFLFILFSSLAHTAIAQRTLFNSNWQFKSVEYTAGESADTLRKAGTNWNDQFSTESVSVRDNGDMSKLSLNNALAPLKDSAWVSVTLPHIAFPEPLVVEHPREGIAFYKKDFVIPDSYKGKIISLEFGAAMQVAWVWVNGEFIERHDGGYLPFFVDLTRIIKYGQKNTIVLRLDNCANSQVPPGKPVNKLDFLYYSGIYRNVWMTVQNPLHITNANQINRVAGGGVFVTYPLVTESKAIMHIKTNVQNQSSKNRKFVLEQELKAKSGKVIASLKSENHTLKQSENQEYNQQLTVLNPRLWSPDAPNLYKLYTRVLENGKMIDQKVMTIGIRKIHIDKEHGLLVNGQPVRIVGSNRHQSYPWIGNALSANANYRDAILIKNAGMNCVRLSHYPQDPSFYDACDSLGIMLLDCVPGWQFFNKSEGFADNDFSDIRQMIRRDRNHPSVILWEVSLNETYPSAAFRCKQVAVAKSEWPTDDTMYTSGDSYFTKACYDVPYDDWAGNIEARNNTTYPDNAYLIREYGDYEFGGDYSTTRQLRSSGENGLLQQAWNLQWEHNRNRQMYPRCIGDLNWAFFDGVSGNLPGIKSWGLADIMRIPKFSYYFLASQKKDAKPMCYIANYWNGTDTTDKVIVYSNCDEIKLMLNGKEIARRHPDDGADTPYGTDLDKGGHPFDGGNVKGLSAPPFTFHVKFIPGELKAVAYKKGNVVASYTVHTPGKPAKIRLIEASQDIPLKADGADVVFVRAQILDKNDFPVYTNASKVHFKMEGPAKIISPVNTHAEAGIATILLQAGSQAGKIKIIASSNGLQSDSIEIKTKN